MQLNQIIHELHRKYDRTYIFIEVEGKEVLAYVNNLAVIGDGNNATGEIVLTTAQYGKLSYKIPTTQQLIFRLPRTTVFQNGKHAHFVTRVPQRQWQRGLCTHNTTIVNLSSFVIQGAAGSSNVLFDLQNVQAAYEGNTFANVAEALAALDKKEVASAALPNCWSLVLSPTKEQDGYMLLYKLTPVARVGKEGKLVRMLNAHFTNAVNFMLEGK